MLKKVGLSVIAITSLFAFNGKVMLKNLYFDYNQQKYVLPENYTGSANLPSAVGENLLSSYNNYLKYGNQAMFQTKLDDPKTKTSDLIKDLNFETIGSTFIKQMVQNKSDMVEFVLIQPLDNTSSHVTIQSRVLNPTKNAQSDFINLSPDGNKYFIGISSKNLGLGGGFEIGEKYKLLGNNYKETVFYLKKINWLGAYSNYIYNYCKQKGYAPVWIFNPVNFLAWTAETIKEGKASINYPSKNIYDSGIVLLSNPESITAGLPATICSMTPKEIADTLKKLKTWHMTDSHGYFNANAEVDRNNNSLFLDNGFIINFPYASYNYIDEIMGSFFATYMYMNNIQHGIMLSDTKPQIHTYTWSTGKYPWHKKYYVKKTIKIGTENYNIVFNSLLNSFNEYTLPSNWENVNYTYVNVLNQLPAVNIPLKTYTPAGHLMTFAFKKGGEVSASEIPGYSFSNTVEKHGGFKWFHFLVTIVAIGSFAYLGALYFTSGLAAGGLPFSTYLNFVASSGTLGLIGQAGAIGFGAAGMIGGGATVGNWFIKKPGGYHETAINSFQNMYENMLQAAKQSTSTLIKNYTYIPILIEHMKPASMLPDIDYRLALSSAQSMHYNLIENNSVQVNTHEFLSGFRNTAASLFYANHEALGKTVIPSNAYYNLQNQLVNSILLHSSTGYLNPSNTIKIIIQREWN